MGNMNLMLWRITLFGNNLQHNFGTNLFLYRPIWHNEKENIKLTKHKNVKIT